MKDKIWKFLLDQYSIGNWHFIPITSVEKKFGKEIRGALNELREEGLICKRRGINADLIEILKYE